jgi:uncharacterized protein YhaN
MRIYSVWAENLKGISSRITVEPAESGTTLIFAPNETGKSTIASVLSLLFKVPSTSISADVKALQTKGVDVPPTAGAIFEIDGERFEVRKQWLKGKSVELKKLSPTIDQWTGNDAESRLDKLFKKVDSTLWALLQTSQADFEKVLRGNSESEANSLTSLIDQAVSNEGASSHESMLKRINDIYESWWTGSGTSLTTKANSNGKKLSDCRTHARKIDEEISLLARNIQEAEAALKELESTTQNTNLLEKVFNAQQKHINLLSLKRTSRLYDEIAATIQVEPRVSEFNPKLWSAANGVRSAEYESVNAAKIIINAKAQLQASIGEIPLQLEEGGIYEQLLGKTTTLIVPGILDLTVQIPSANNDSENNLRVLESALKALGCSNMAEADELRTKHLDLENLRAQLEELLNGKDIQIELRKLEIMEAEVLEDPDFETFAQQEKVSAQEVIGAGKDQGREEGRSSLINEKGWAERISELTEELSEMSKIIRRMEIDSEAIKVVREGLIHHKNESLLLLSKHFEEKLNELAKGVYGTGVSFEVNQKFEVTYRVLGGVRLSVLELSTGAKEQLAILIRLTIAALTQKGQPVPIFLDDEFGHTDSERLSAVAKLFESIGDEMQIILLTCSPDRFSSFNFSKRIVLKNA